VNSENQAYMAGVGEEKLSTYFILLTEKSSRTYPFFRSKFGMLTYFGLPLETTTGGGEANIIYCTTVFLAFDKYYFAPH
jgi:hypothetical protein